jgi:regulator of extracellular matrix RemA (YlzA/DUF370 family)
MKNKLILAGLVGLIGTLVVINLVNEETYVSEEVIVVDQRDNIEKLTDNYATKYRAVEEADSAQVICDTNSDTAYAEFAEATEALNLYTK